MSQATKPCALEPYNPVGVSGPSRSMCKNCGIWAHDSQWARIKTSIYAPGCKAYVAPAPPIDNDIFLEGPPPPVKAPSKHGDCYDCGIELSPYLDATYERRLQGLCSRCQKSAHNRAPYSSEP